MNGLLLLAIAAALLLTAYLVYGRYLVKTWGIDPKAKTPAYEKEDGVDYVPSNKWKYLDTNSLQLPEPVQ